MKSRCINYKFVLMSIFPVIGSILGVCLLCFTDKIYALPFILISISVISLICLTILEPIGYLIGTSGIKVKFVFKSYYFDWQHIKQISVYFDARFHLLFIKDYLIITAFDKLPNRSKRILKCRRTTNLIEKFALNKMSDLS